MQHTHDCNGQVILPGDTVLCLVGHYRTQHRNTKSVVIHTDYTCVTLEPTANKWLYEGDNPTVRYTARNFKLVERTPENQLIVDQLRAQAIRKENGMATALQIAIRIPEGMEREEFMQYVMGVHTDKTKSLDMMIRMSPHILKSDLTKRINDNPSERWYCVNTTLIAETASAPIKFNSW